MLQHGETFLLKPPAQQARKPAIRHATAAERNSIHVGLNPCVASRIDEPFSNACMKSRRNA
jgi:hypothetical protein